MPLSRYALLGSVLVLNAAPAAAQAGASPELLPTKLVEALFTAGVYGRPSFIVGSLPPTVQSKIALPSNATVLGGMNAGESAVGVFVIEGALNTAADNFTKELLKGGWEVMDQAPQMFFGQEFLDAPSTQRRPVTSAPETYCGRAGTLRVRFDPEGFSQTRVTVVSMAVNQCAQMRDQMLRSRVGMGMGSEPSRPRLFNPGDARNQAGLCPNYNMGMGGRGTELNSRMAPEEILAHYAKQLADSGWTRNGTGVSASWTKTDTAGVVTEYQVTVRTASQSPMCRKVDSELRARSR